MEAVRFFIHSNLHYIDMTQKEESGLRKIRRALFSVSDKTGIVDFAQGLKRFGVEIISTGGTANALREAGIDVIDVVDVTGFPEMMDGRVKTLHPMIHGALLGLRDNPDHQAAMREHEINPIDLVVINLYPFEKTIANVNGVKLEEAIEQIDIGGPAMIRSAAKNFKDVGVVVSPDNYRQILSEIDENNGALTLDTRARLARQAFMRTAGYDAIVTAYLSQTGCASSQGGSGILAGIGGSSSHAAPELVTSIEDVAVLPTFAQWTLRKTSDLRYGENPHQHAALYKTGASAGIASAEILAGKEMSYNNYVDGDAAWQLVWDFAESACAIIKHTNPAGVGLGSTSEEAYRKARETDPLSAFGGIVAFNHMVDERAARAVIEIFTEVVIAPEYEPAALDTLKTKKNLRVLRAESGSNPGLEYRQITGGMLVQTRDRHKLNRKDLKVVSKRLPTEGEIRAMLFAWTVCKHTKSNAIVYARDGQTVGVGAGQMSRVDSVKIGAMRAQLPLRGSVLASDAFFPFRDGIDEAAKHGITAVIQPGGSVRDSEVIEAADEHGLAMVFTGIRHFKH